MPKSNPFHFRESTFLDKLRCRLKYYNSYSRKKFIPQINHEQEALLQTLKSEGCIILENYIDPKILNKMQQELRENLENLNFQTPCLAQTKVDEEKHSELIANHMLGSQQQLSDWGVTFGKEDAISYQQVLEDFNPSTLTVPMLEHSETYRNIWTDPFLLGIISTYLGLVPQLAEAYVRRNFPAPHKTMNHFWHRDLNNKDSLLKMFVFLSDCTLKTGPHEFIPKSHTDFTKLNDKRYFTDEEVDQAYPEDSSRTVSEVKAGTVVIEDTRGVHRACLPEEGYRDLGFAVFMPLRPFYPYKNYSFPKAAFANLSKFRQSFIPESCVD